MITLGDHIKMMEHIQKGGLPSQYLETMKPLEKLDFLRDSEITYPIKEHLKEPKSIVANKNISTTINDLVLGQFIMLEQIITGKTKLADHRVDLEIAKLIIRPKHHKEFDNQNILDEKKNQQDILSYDVREVYHILDNFIEDRNKVLFNDFKGVFYDPVDDDEEVDEEPEKKTSDMLFHQQWYWYSIVRMLANEDITRYSDIYMLPMPVVLPEMSYLAQRNKIEAAKQREQQAMRRL
jgi:hypothetical protein